MFTDGANPVILEVFLREFASLSAAVWVFGVPGNWRSVGFFFLQRNVTKRMFVFTDKLHGEFFLCNQSQWNKKEKKNHKTNSLITSTDRLHSAAMKLQSLSLQIQFFQTVKHNLCSQTDFAMYLRVRLSCLSLRGFPLALNFHLFSSALIPRQYASSKTL